MHALFCFISHSNAIFVTGYLGKLFQTTTTFVSIQNTLQIILHEAWSWFHTILQQSTVIQDYFFADQPLDEQLTEFLEF